MNLLLDENLPKYLKRVLADHQVTTVQEAGWSGFSNGESIRRMEGVFEVFLTADKNLRYPQNLAGRSVAIIELPTNRLPLLKALEPQFLKALTVIEARAYVILEPSE